MVSQAASNGGRRWWKDKSPALGVFEGGGQKGIMYVGALQALLDRGVWFHGVAGSSAGAITASFIAAGLHPTEMRRRSAEALERMVFPTTRNLLYRVRHGTGFLDHIVLREWLRAELANAYATQRNSGHPNTDDPTFGDLFLATGIECNVVAVDLKARQIAVFNHKLTEHVSVADAVMASATIPFAFEAPILYIHNGEGKQLDWTKTRTFVDAGIAANYPAFVFRDTGFRKYAELEQYPRNIPVLGFLLRHQTELQEQAQDDYARGSFHGTWTEQMAEVKDASKPKYIKFRARRAEAGPIKQFLARLATPVRWLLTGVEHAILPPLSAFLRSMIGWPSPNTLGQPRNKRADRWTTLLTTFLQIAPGWIVFGGAIYLVVFSVGTYIVASEVGVPLAQEIGRAFPAHLGQVFIGSILMLLLVGSLLIAALVSVFGLLVFLVAVHVYRTIAWIGKPLAQTFLQTPQAPPWVDEGPETVIRLSVPDGVSTLRITLEDEVLDSEIAKAREHTAKELADASIGRDSSPETH